MILKDKSCEHSNDRLALICGVLCPKQQDFRIKQGVHEVGRQRQARAVVIHGLRFRQGDEEIHDCKPECREELNGRRDCY